MSSLATLPRVSGFISPDNKSFTSSSGIVAPCKNLQVNSFFSHIVKHFYTPVIVFNPDGERDIESVRFTHLKPSFIRRSLNVNRKDLRSIEKRESVVSITDNSDLVKRLVEDRKEKIFLGTIQLFDTHQVEKIFTAIVTLAYFIASLQINGHFLPEERFKSGTSFYHNRKFHTLPASATILSRDEAIIHLKKKFGPWTRGASTKAYDAVWIKGNEISLIKELTCDAKDYREPTWPGFKSIYIHQDVLKALHYTSKGKNKVSRFEEKFIGDMYHSLLNTSVKNPHPVYEIKDHEAIRILINIAEGVQVMHNAGWIHRDLKPANILLKHKIIGGEASFIAQICDLERAVQEDKVRKGWSGTKRYLPPEVLEKRAIQSKSSDMFALGVIIKEIILHFEERKLPFRYYKSLRNLSNSLLSDNYEERPTINTILTTLKQIYRSTLL